jgi:hypothetical protein
MSIQEQLSKPQQLHLPAYIPQIQSYFNVGLLGNKYAQAPSSWGEADTLPETYQRLVSAAQPAFKFALLKQQKFTPQGRQERIAASVAALNVPQPTELSLAQWKDVIEEIEDDEG